MGGRGIRSYICSRTAHSEGMVGSLTEVFNPGKPVLVRILSNDKEKGRILASIRQAATNVTPPDISAAEVGDSVAGTISEVHKDNVLLNLEPSNIRALLSIKNLANRRSSTVGQLRVNLKTGEKLDDLLVVSRNTEQGFVIVATRPIAKPALGAISIDSVQVGQIVGGRVVRHDRRGAVVKFNGRITGFLHPTDASDDYEAGLPFPNVDSVLKAVVIAIDREAKHLTLSTRKSRMEPSEYHAVADLEIASVEDAKPGTFVRGFIKSVAEHGLFVSIGRDLDARVQIKELFDEVCPLRKTILTQAD
jgi:rRNA biogenesis protein RRP5